jgi:ABC-type branched-subunit amino acid transport system permease subunit
VLVASLYFLVAVVVGGAASTLGPAIGAFFVGFFQDVVTKDWMPARIQPATPLILGALLIVLMLVAPGGIAGLTRQTLNRVQMSWQRRAALQSTDQGES